MSAFTIKFRNFSIFVHHSKGLTVLFGAHDHELLMRLNGATQALRPGVELRLKAIREGTELIGGPTRQPMGPYMPLLDWMFAAKRPIDQNRVTGGNFDNQNGRLHLSAGLLDDLPSDSEGGGDMLRDVRWDFSDLGAPPDGLHRITNMAAFSREIEPGVAYGLFDGEALVTELTSDTDLEFVNRDRNKCKDLAAAEGEVPDEELPFLLLAGGVETGGKTARLPDSRIVPHGSGSICQPCQSTYTVQDF